MIICHKTPLKALGFQPSYSKDANKARAGYTGFRLVASFVPFPTMKVALALEEGSRKISSGRKDTLGRSGEDDASAPADGRYGGVQRTMGAPALTRGPGGVRAHQGPTGANERGNSLAPYLSANDPVAFGCMFGISRAGAGREAQGCGLFCPGRPSRPQSPPTVWRNSVMQLHFCTCGVQVSGTSR